MSCIFSISTASCTKRHNRLYCCIYNIIVCLPFAVFYTALPRVWPSQWSDSSCRHSEVCLNLNFLILKSFFSEVFSAAFTWQRIHMYHANYFAFFFTKHANKSSHYKIKYILRKITKIERSKVASAVLTIFLNTVVTCCYLFECTLCCSPALAAVNI